MGGERGRGCSILLHTWRNGLPLPTTPLKFSATQAPSLWREESSTFAPTLHTKDQAKTSRSSVLTLGCAGSNPSPGSSMHLRITRVHQPSSAKQRQAASSKGLGEGKGGGKRAGIGGGDRGRAATSCVSRLVPLVLRSLPCRIAQRFRPMSTARARPLLRVWPWGSRSPLGVRGGAHSVRPCSAPSAAQCHLGACTPGSTMRSLDPGR